MTNGQMKSTHFLIWAFQLSAMVRDYVNSLVLNVLNAPSIILVTLLKFLSGGFKKRNIEKGEKLEVSDDDFAFMESHFEAPTKVEMENGVHLKNT